jgi:glycolate oxidase FAD binding subunit
MADLFIDDVGPLPVMRPQSPAEIGEIVRRAAAEGQALFPVGGRTMLGLGNPPNRPGWAVDLRGLDQVIDYPARDMTITVQAGITMARLQEILAPENQRLPIDVPCADRATLGGVLASNVSGPRRYGHGTLRDYVLGISAVNDLGEEIKAGGRVVKNVAGYDLCKLFVGSLGTLGIITQATLKLRPLPDEQALITLSCPSDAIAGLLDRLHSSRTRPVCLELLNPPAAQSLRLDGDATHWRLVVGYEGNADAIRWQMQQVIRELSGVCSLEVRIGATALPGCHALGEFLLPTDWEDREGSLSFKVNLLSSATADFCVRADALPARPLLQAHAGNGIVIGHAGPGLSLRQAQDMVNGLRELAVKGQGHVVVLRCPAAWKKAISVWGPPPGDIALMHAVKEKLDPGHLFNPGRFVDGI